MKKFFKKFLLFLLLFAVIGLFLSRCENIHNTDEKNVRPETIIRTPEEYQKELERQIQQGSKHNNTFSAYAADVDTSAFENGTSFIGLPGVLQGIDIFFDVLDFAEPVNAGLQSVTLYSTYHLTGKHRVEYTSGAYEILTLTVSMKSYGDGFLGDVLLERSGTAGTTSRSFYIKSGGVEIYTSYTGTSFTCYPYDGIGNGIYGGASFYGSSVNNIFTTEHNEVVNDAFCLCTKYSETLFITNREDVKTKHDYMFLNNNYFSRPSIIAPIPYKTTIDTTNVNDYSIYGFGIGSDGNLTFDSDLFFSYLDTNFLPLILSAYKEIYNNFPDIGVEYPDEGGNRNVLIVEPPPDSDIVVPLSTLPPHWLEDTAYLDTSPDIVLDTYDVSDIVEKSVLDSHVVQNSGGFIWLVSDFMQDNGLLSLVLFVVILSVIFAFLRF